MNWAAVAVPAVMTGAVIIVWLLSRIPPPRSTIDEDWERAEPEWTRAEERRRGELL